MTDADHVLRGLGRAFGGAILFALPVFMTMEVWQLALSVPNYRLALLVVTTIAIAVVLSRYLGFQKKSEEAWRQSAIDAAVALLVGFLAAGLVLWLLSVIEPALTWRNAVSIVAIEALPATIGASFARAQLGEGQGVSGSHPSYGHQLFLMAAGAVVFVANIAPTEEVVLIAAKMTEFNVVLLVAVELALMHGFVYAVGFKGGWRSRGFWTEFAQFTIVGYVIAALVSAYVLWSFGRFDGTGLLPVVVQTVVLTLPASLGAAAARLIL